VYEESRYPDQASPDNLAHVTLEARPPSVTDEEGQVIGIDDYELEEEESEISDSNESDHDQVTRLFTSCVRTQRRIYSFKHLIVLRTSPGRHTLTHVYWQVSQNNVGLLDRQLDPDNEAVRLRQEAYRLHAQIAAGVDVAMPLHISGLHGHYSDNLYMFSSIGSFEPTSSQYVDESSDYRVCSMSTSFVTYWLLLFHAG